MQPILRLESLVLFHHFLCYGMWCPGQALLGYSLGSAHSDEHGDSNGNDDHHDGDGDGYGG